MSVVTLDFETYWSNTYSLSRMSEVDYILNPLFQVILVSIKEGDGPVQAYSEPAEVERALAAIDWGNVALLSHNMRFDGAILAWHYGYTPRLYLDTLSMARALTHAEKGSSSLKAVAEHLGLPPKGDEVMRAMGVRREDFTPGELDAYARYCAHDTELCHAIFRRFIAEYKFPTAELAVIDLSLRMFIEPMVKLNMHKLALHHHQLVVERERMFARTERALYASNEKFAQLLIDQGISPPRKLSPTTGKLTWALSKNDREFKELCDNPSLPLAVQLHLALRKGAKSTIEETRTLTMLNLSRRDWEGRGNAWMPVPYLYFGAHTGRFSGTAGFNFANLPRGSVIRDSIVAPDGWRILHRDASQIECRMLAWLAGCNVLLEGFREGRDVYSEFASLCYLRSITKADAKERFTGKTAVLSLGYGASGARFRQTLYIGQGGVSVDLSDGEADTLVRMYRDYYREIPALWNAMAIALDTMVGGRGVDGPITVIDIRRDRVVLPNGLALRYPDLAYTDEGTGRYVITYKGPRGERKKLYGAKLVENITQALARIVVTDIMCRVHHETGYRPFMGTYDSWDYCCPEGSVRELDEILLREFCTPPVWARDLPLASEGGWGRTLLEAEQGVNR
jgi:DNA polymerase